MERVIALVDMDCFYVQVEQREKPELKGQPCAVVQYNQWKGGGIIAVGYEARACGVTRQMRGNEAKSKCPEIALVSVPNVRGKADLQKYRDAGAEVIEVLSRFSKLVERASIDEAYIDLTDEVEKRIENGVKVEPLDLANTFVSGYDDVPEGEEIEGARLSGVSSWLKELYDGTNMEMESALKLAVGGMIAEEMREAVYRDTGFRCSAGIAHNKVLAKLVCGLHKPNKQTVLPHSAVPHLFSKLPIKKVRNLGGKFGKQLIEDFNIEFMSELAQLPLKTLQERCGDKNGLWVYEICQGIDKEPVSARQLPKSIGCSKNFTGKQHLDTKDKVKYWVTQLCEEVVERLDKDKEMNGRTAKLLNVSLSYRNGDSSQSASRSCAIVKYDSSKITHDALTLLNQFNTAPGELWTPPILNIGISAQKFAYSDNSSVAKFLVTHVSSASQSSPSACSQVKQQCKRKRKSGIDGIFSAMLEKQSALESKKNTDSVDNIQSTEQVPLSSKDDNISHKNTGRSDQEGKRITFGGFFAAKAMQLKSQMPTSVQKSPIHSMNSHTYSDDDDFEQPSKKLIVDTKDMCETSSVRLSSCKTVDKILNFVDSKNANISLNCNNDKEHVKTEILSKEENDMKEETSNEFFPSPFKSLTENIDKDNEELICGNNQVKKTEPSDYMKCPECGKHVLIWEMPEHSDFHFAQNIMKAESAEFRSMNGVNISNEKRKSNISGSTGLKRNKISSEKHTTKLTNFFQKKS